VTWWEFHASVPSVNVDFDWSSRTRTKTNERPVPVQAVWFMEEQSGDDERMRHLITSEWMAVVSVCFK
jgi:hypothetical protein